MKEIKSADKDSKYLLRLKKKIRKKKDIVESIPDTPENIARALFGLKPVQEEAKKS